jgi:hypothetical protein
MRRSSFTLVAWAGLFGLVAPVAVTRGQAWLSPQGEAYFSLGYGNMFATDHFTFSRAPGSPPSDSTPVDRGHIRSQTVAAQVGYAITDRFTVQLGIPFTQAKWYRSCDTCGNPHTFADGSTLDDGNFHGSFADFRLEALYQVVRNPVVLTPFFGAVIPSHNYQYFAHSAVGRDLHEYLVGTFFGSSLERILPGGYVQAMYSYAFVEEVLVEGIGSVHHDRSNGALELGYFLTPSLGVRFLAGGFYTHGGLSFRRMSDFGPPPYNSLNPIFLHHDQVEHASGINLGGGFSYQLTGTVDVFASYMRTVMGHSGHKIDNGISFGFTWGFSPRRVVRGMFGPKNPAAGPPAQ